MSIEPFKVNSWEPWASLGNEGRAVRFWGGGTDWCRKVDMKNISRKQKLYIFLPQRLTFRWHCKLYRCNFYLKSGVLVYWEAKSSCGQRTWCPQLPQSSRSTLPPSLGVGQPEKISSNVRNLSLNLNPGFFELQYSCNEKIRKNRKNQKE